MMLRRSVPDIDSHFVTQLVQAVPALSGVPNRRLQALFVLNVLRLVALTEQGTFVLKDSQPALLTVAQAHITTHRGGYDFPQGFDINKALSDAVQVIVHTSQHVETSEPAHQSVSQQGFFAGIRHRLSQWREKRRAKQTPFWALKRVWLGAFVLVSPFVLLTLSSAAHTAVQAMSMHTVLPLAGLWALALVLLLHPRIGLGQKIQAAAERLKVALKPNVSKPVKPILAGVTRRKLKTLHAAVVQHLADLSPTLEGWLINVVGAEPVEGAGPSALDALQPIQSVSWAASAPLPSTAVRGEPAVPTPVISRRPSVCHVSRTPIQRLDTFEVPRLSMTLQDALDSLGTDKATQSAHTAFENWTNLPAAMPDMATLHAAQSEYEGVQYSATAADKLEFCQTYIRALQTVVIDLRRQVSNTAASGQSFSTVEAELTKLLTDQRRGNAVAPILSVHKESLLLAHAQRGQIVRTLRRLEQTLEDLYPVEEDLVQPTQRSPSPQI